MTWIGGSALAFSPFAGPLLWALVLRHAPPEPELTRDGAGDRPRALSDAVPVLGWIGHVRADGAIGDEARRRALFEIGAFVVAVWAVAEMDAVWVWPTCVLGWLLLADAAVDVRARILPDEINAAVALTGLLAAIPLGRAEVFSHVLGAVIGLAVFVGFAALYARIRGRDGLGLGDAKLLGALGAWVGWEGLASVASVAAGSAIAATLVGALLTRRLPRGQDETRFGPFLALGGWLTWIYGPIGFLGAG